MNGSTTLSLCEFLVGQLAGSRLHVRSPHGPRATTPWPLLTRCCWWTRHGVDFYVTMTVELVTQVWVCFECFGIQIRSNITTLFLGIEFVCLTSWTENNEDMTQSISFLQPTWMGNLLSGSLFAYSRGPYPVNWTGWWCSPSWKKIVNGQWEGSSHILWKIKNLRNHQPVD